MIDIHTHILPAFDDGVATMDEATALIAMEVSGGTKGFFATPHFVERRDYNRVEELDERIDALRGAMAREGLCADILIGGEIYPTSAMLEAIDSGKSLTLAGQGKHMLVDLPLMSLPHDFDELLYEIQMRGVTPILAHPERAATFQQDPDRLVEYIDKGFPLQVNAGSLSGKYGSRARETATYILDRRWASFLASDSHRPGRKPVLGECARHLLPQLGKDYVDYLTVVCPRCVQEGRDLPPRPTAPRRGRTFLQKLFNRRRR